MSLPRDEVQVWSFSLDLAPAIAARCAASLSAEERARAAAFHFVRDREHYVAARGTLRELLGGYLGCAPASVRFANGAQGKPRLADPSARDADEDSAPDVRFNVSHSHGRALIAVTRGVEIGVDLEQIRVSVDAEGIVASHFSPAERAAWAALPQAVRHEAFFHGWVRKEAYVKARGEGFSRAPSLYTVELASGAAGALLADEQELAAPLAWTVRAIRAPVGFTAALAYAGPLRSVRWCELPR